MSDLFYRMDDYITDVVNCLFAELPTKRRAKENLMVYIVAACYEYQKSPEFKSKIDAYAELHRGK